MENMYQRRMSIKWASTLMGLAMVGSVLLTPSEVEAQACLGSPALPGEFTMGGTVSLADGMTGYGATASANLDGPISVGGSAGIHDLDNVDSNVTVLSGRVAYELPVEDFSACPFGGVGYATWSDSFQGVSGNLSELSLPLGMGVGIRVGEEDSMALIPSAEAGLVYFRLSGSISDGVDRIEDSTSETEFFVGGGATLQMGHFYGRAGVSKTTLDGSDAVVNLGFGLVF